MRPQPLAPPISAAVGPVTLGDIFLVFLRAGCLGFGGFMSLIAVVENLIVERRKLIKHEEVLDAISLASLLPGPQAVNVCAWCGHKLRGVRGAIVACVAVILPSFVLMLVLSQLYAQYGQLDVVARIFHGIVPAVAAVIVSVVWRMAKQTVKGPTEVVLVGVAAFTLLATSLSLFGIPKTAQLYVTFAIVIAYGFVGAKLFGAPAAAAAPAARKPLPLAKFAWTLAMAAVLITLGLVHPALDPNSNLNLASTFSGLSLMLFGGGYVIIPMIQHLVVDGFHWVTTKEFIDCIAISQVMPGPILICAAFIGFKVSGFAGALIATIAIFAPSAIVMVVASQALDHFKKSTVAKAVMRGIRCGVIGMILVAAFVVLRTSLPADLTQVRAVWPSLLLFAGALFALVRFEIDIVWVVPISGAIGYFLYA